jgi:GWxTD domain-containing protein
MRLIVALYGELIKVFIAGGILLCSFGCPAQAQINAFYGSCAFSIPGREPFLETYITLAGNSLKAMDEGGRLRNSANIEIQISKEGNLVRSRKYNLHGPAFASAGEAPAFIDNQRYPLANGNYELRVKISDNNDHNAHPIEFVDDIRINFGDTSLQSSGLQLIESYHKSETQGPITKSGYDMVPYNANYYPETVNHLNFYLETYNAEKVLGTGKPLLFSYFLESTKDHLPLDAWGAFKKQTTAEVNPLIGRLDISKLGSGYYNLVVQVKDGENRLRMTKKIFFVRSNASMDVVSLQKLDQKRTIAEYVGNCNNADTLRMYVECVWPIADNNDKERSINISIKHDPEMMKNFIVDFWQRHAADTVNPVKLWAAYYREVQAAMKLFKCGKQKGYFSERGRVFLQYGPPNQRAQQNNEQNTFPYEIWHYYRLTDRSTGRVFSNRKFVFVNRMLGDDCHTLVHSDMQGEVNNPRWQFELTRRSTDGLSNPDNNTPGGTQTNQFNDLYSVPR